MTRALILVDIQNDFMPTGALPVADGDAVVPIANQLAAKFDCVVATQDWHPANHGSFATQHEGHAPGELIELHGLTQVLWPDHCVQHTAGAEFVDGLDESQITKVFPKGTDVTIDSYSGFFDNGQRQDTGLAKWLEGQGVTKVYVLGVATDYCVKFTALDAVGCGFETVLVEDACRGVEMNPGDIAAALTEMTAAGVARIQSRDV